MKIVAVVIALVVSLVVPQVAQAATMFYLVQVDSSGATLYVLGNYSTAEQCLAELKKEKAKAAAGVFRCQPIGSSTGGSYSNGKVYTPSTPSYTTPAGEGWYTVARPYGDYSVYTVLGGPYDILMCDAVKTRVDGYRGYRVFCMTLDHIRQLQTAGARINWSK